MPPATQEEPLPGAGSISSTAQPASAARKHSSGRSRRRRRSRECLRCRLLFRHHSAPLRRHDRIRSTVGTATVPSQPGAVALVCPGSVRNHPHDTRQRPQRYCPALPVTQRRLPNCTRRGHFHDQHCWCAVGQQGDVPSGPVPALDGGKLRADSPTPAVPVTGARQRTGDLGPVRRRGSPVASTSCSCGINPIPALRWRPARRSPRWRCSPRPAPGTARLPR